MNELYDLKEALIDELSKYSRSRIDKRNLCDIDMLAHATKNVCKIIDSMGESDGEYYSRRGYNSPHRYSRRQNSYHDHNDMIDELKELMYEAPDETSRQEFQKLISKLER